MNRNIWVWGIAAVIISLVLTTSMPSDQANGENRSIDEKPLVVCTTTILASFAGEVGGEKVDVMSLVPPGMCPAHFDVKPSDVYAISKASLVIESGIEPWLNDIISSSGNTEVTVHSTGGLGPWNVPSNAFKYITNITYALCTAFPENSTYFEQESITLCEYINSTAQGLEDEAAQYCVNETKVICMQWQEGFVKWLGFDVVKTYKPPESLSQQEILDIIDTANRENVALVIDNLQSGTEFGARLASETKAVHVILSNFPGAVPKTDNYTTMIQYNSKQLLNGTQSYKIKQGMISDLEEQVDGLSFQNALLLTTTIIFLMIALAEGIVIYRKKR